jgi:hypothetical protein
MTQRNKRLAIEFGLALAVCGVIAAFDRPLIGLTGVGLCVVIFALRIAAAQSPSDPPSRTNGAAVEPSSTEREHVVAVEPPLHYDPTNTLYYPPDR